MLVSPVMCLSFGSLLVCGAGTAHEACKDAIMCLGDRPCRARQDPVLTCVNILVLAQVAMSQGVEPHLSRGIFVLVRSAAGILTTLIS